MIALGFEGPIGAQEEALTLAASGRDLVLSSPTGSGKTLALVLPLLQWHTARSAAAAATRRAERGQASVAMKGSSLHEQFALAASAVSASAVQAISTARVVSVVLAPTATLALQLLGSMRATAAGWIKAAAKIHLRLSELTCPHKKCLGPCCRRRLCAPPLLPPHPCAPPVLSPAPSLAYVSATPSSVAGPPRGCSLSLPACRVDTSGLILFATPETLKRLVTVRFKPSFLNGRPPLTDFTLREETDCLFAAIGGAPISLAPTLSKSSLGSRRVSPSRPCPCGSVCLSCCLQRLAGGPPGSLLHLAGAVRHLVLDEADRMLQPLRRHAPLQERLQSLKKPEALEIFMRLLVTSRKQGGLKGTGSNAASSHHGRSQQQPVLPLQLVAASATVGRPLHRRLTAFVRWKEQQLTRAKDPPLRAGFLGVPHLCPLSGRTRQLDLRKPPLGVFATPQQRMRAALERLAARGLLGIPPIPSTAEGPQALSMLSPSLPPFKALLPIREPPTRQLAAGHCAGGRIDVYAIQYSRMQQKLDFTHALKRVFLHADTRGPTVCRNASVNLNAAVSCAAFHLRSPATRLAERSAKEPQAERNPTGDSRASKGGDEESPRVPRRVGGMPPCITHALFSASDNSAEPLVSVPSRARKQPSCGNGEGCYGDETRQRTLRSTLKNTLFFTARPPYSSPIACGAEGLAIAASAVCNSLKHHRTLLLLQQGSSLRSLQIYMREQGLKVHQLSLFDPSCDAKLL
ncbi:uncharacterized protein LOC34619926 [Cyclospora cayetanensis]|uniref:ATP-dependent RNA helicase n=1 Tax=Cyclospora cayetanensis TaxID=88456 RepID=A0A6P6RRB8_9EIME|nr:uncharacterized protein LOC34619926 [Cyclospora cayetanensis]